MPIRLLTATAIITVAAIAFLTAGVSAVPTHEDSTSATVHLNSSQAALDLARQLPLESSFSDRMGAAEISQLTTPLSTFGATRDSVHSAGDIAYLPSQRLLVVFTRDFRAPGLDLITLGTIRTGLPGLSACVRDCAVVLSGR